MSRTSGTTAPCPTPPSTVRVKHTVLLPPRSDGSDAVGIVAALNREPGEYVGAGEPLLVVRFDGIEEFVLSDRHGVLFRWSVLPGDALQPGEPVAVLSGVVSPALVFAPQPPVLGEIVGFSQTWGPGGRETGERIARHHVGSWRAAPHVPCVARVDLSETLRLAQKARCAPLAFLLAATASALAQHPRFNVGPDVRLAVGEILIADADKKSVLQLARECTSGAGGEGASFTLTDLTASGVLTLAPILRQPQVGHLVFGAIVGSEIHLTLVHDARIATELHAAEFLTEIKRNLEAAHFLFV